MDPLWSETCWSTFKYFIILIVSTYYILCISWIIKCLMLTLYEFGIRNYCHVLLNLEVFANFSLLTFDLTLRLLSCGTFTVWTVQVHWRFGRIWNRHCSHLPTTETLKSVPLYQTTRRHITEDEGLLSYRHENFKCHWYSLIQKSNSWSLIVNDLPSSHTNKCTIY